MREEKQLLLKLYIAKILGDYFNCKLTKLIYDISKPILEIYQGVSEYKIKPKVYLFS